MSDYANPRGRTPAEDQLRVDPAPPTVTLRQWYAGQALVAYGGSLAEVDVQWIEQHGAKNAYRIADAITAEGKKP